MNINKAEPAQICHISYSGTQLAFKQTATELFLKTNTLFELEPICSLDHSLVETKILASSKNDCLPVSHNSMSTVQCLP